VTFHTDGLTDSHNLLLQPNYKLRPLKMEAACSSEALVYYTISQPRSHDLNSVVLPALGIRKVQGLCSEKNCVTSSIELSPSSEAPSYSRIYQHFIEAKGSLPCSQDTSTWPYLGQMKPVLLPHPTFLRYILILPYLRPGILFLFGKKRPTFRKYLTCHEWYECL
jgi:hypothetical protein